MTNRVQAVERSIGILMALANGARTLTDVTRATGLSKGTAFRLLASLNYEQLVVKDPAANVYLLGPGFLRMFQGVMGDLGSIGTLARPQLQELWKHSAETVTLHVSIGAERICVAELPSPQPIRYVSQVGATAPLHVGSAGKVLLAFLDPTRLERTLAALSLTPITGATTTDADVLRQELDTVARQGWAMSTGERIIGAVGDLDPGQAAGRACWRRSACSGPSDRLSLAGADGAAAGAQEGGGGDRGDLGERRPRDRGPGHRTGGELKERCMATVDHQTGLRERYDQWLASHRESLADVREEFETSSGIPVEPVYTPLDLEERGFDYERDLGLPGEEP